ncbi:MAG: xylulokinase [Christensenellales bacterium]
MAQGVLGLDIGTSGVKAAIFGADGAILASASSGYGYETPRPGAVEQHPDTWWGAVCACARRLTEQVAPGDIAAVGVDGQSWAAVLVDAAGECLGPTPIWMDTQAKALCDGLDPALKAALFACSGNPFTPGYTLPKVMLRFSQDPEARRRARYVLQSNSYIVFRLTGRATQDLSQGYGWHFFRPGQGDYDPELARAVGVPLEKLPDPLPCHQVVGQITEAAARLIGLLPGTPVVAGGLDAACGTLGAGVIAPGQTQEQSGQAGGMSICTDRLRFDPRLIFSPHVVPGRYLLQGGSVGGAGALNWFARELGGFEAAAAQADGRSVFEHLSDCAAAAPLGAGGLIFLPYMAGERSPHWDESAQGMYFGLGYDKGRGHLVRALMEGVAYSLYDNLLAAEQAGVAAGDLICVGGAANSAVWTQIKADVTGHTLHVPRGDTATTLGAAMLAGVGVGYWDGFERAVAACCHIRRTYRPDPAAHAAYGPYFALYRQLYQDNRRSMAALRRLAQE